ncbi:MAG: tetratricopeptide repeat protein [Bacteroidetes bacterium]|nr:tetratricopeptide repeat protein [Bacteroidota bacterium]
MNDNFEKIESYLNGSMTPEEKGLFERELADNDELQQWFNIYSTINAEMYNAQKYSDQEAALKNTLSQLTEKYFNQQPTQVISLNRKSSFIKTAMAVAAGLIVIFVTYFTFFNNNNSPTQLANRYVKNELTHLSQTMDGAKDSLQQGIAAYNNKEYKKALQLFEAVYTAHPGNSDALRYAGTVYLINKDYDKALRAFDELALKTELFSNAGPFLKAVTLLQRNSKGDKDAAKLLLQNVVKENQEGSSEAKQWLNHW